MSKSLMPMGSGMRGYGMAALGLLLPCTTLLAQKWATFVDETDTRLVAVPSLGSEDTEEKDYDWGDIDQDGDLDLVVARKQEWTTTGRRPNVLFMNEGIKEGNAFNGILVDRTTEYASASDVPGSQGFLDLTNDRDVKMFDVNGDDWLDVVTATTLSGDQPKYISHPRVYINLGEDEDGNWLGLLFDDEDRIPTMPFEPRFCGMDFGDIDVDGDNDLYYSDYDQGPYQRPGDLDDRLLINDGTGYFTDESSLRMTPAMLDSAFGTSTAIVDMNGDGYLDIVKDSGLVEPLIHVTISYNNPVNPGYFNLMNVPYEGAPYFVSVGDLNNDNKPDFIISDDGSDHYNLNKGNGDDSMSDFISKTFTFTGGESDDGFGGGNDIVDLNNDGWKDVIIADVDVDISGCTRRTHIYRNLGNAPSVKLQEQTVGTNCASGNSQTCSVVGITLADLQGTHDVAPFDINGDGWVDLVVGRCSSTEVYINQPPIGLTFDYPDGLPAGFITPDQDTTFKVHVAGTGSGQPLAGSGAFFLSTEGGPFVETPMKDLLNHTYEATIPASACLTSFDFYFTAEEVGGTVFSDPLNAPDSSFSTLASLGEEIIVDDGIEGDVSGWIIESDDSLTSGEWEQADPNQTFNTLCGIVSPEEDAGAGEDVLCFVTQNGDPGGPPGLTDVDDGATFLTAPVVDLAGTDGIISYSRFFVTCSATKDSLNVEVSNDDGANWTLVESVTDTLHAWEVASFLVSDYVTPTSTLRVRFSTSDFDLSITDAGIDNFQVSELLCVEVPPPSCEGDANGDNTVDPLDSGYVLARLGCPVGTGDADCDSADQNGDGEVDPLDAGFVAARYGDCP